MTCSAYYYYGGIYSYVLYNNSGLCIDFMAAWINHFHIGRAVPWKCYHSLSYGSSNNGQRVLIESRYNNVSTHTSMVSVVADYYS